LTYHTKQPADTGITPYVTEPPGVVAFGGDGYKDYDLIARSNITLLHKSRFNEWCSTQKLLNATDLKVCIQLTRLYNDKKKCAWPSLRMLSETTGISRSSICISIDKLDLCDIVLRLSGDSNRSNRYIPNFLHAPDNRAELDHLSGCPDTAGPDSRTQPVPPDGHPASGHADPILSLPPVASSETGVRESVVNDSVSDAVSNQTAPPGWEVFWAYYPKKTGYEEAKEAYRMALTRGVTPELLAEKAIEYATAVLTWDNPRFISNPANWLNKNKFKETFKPYFRDPVDHGGKKSAKGKKKKTPARSRKNAAKPVAQAQGKQKQPPSRAAEENGTKAARPPSSSKSIKPQILEIADHQEFGPVFIHDRSTRTVRFSKTKRGKSTPAPRSYFTNFKPVP
jgi:hypothetical protein